VDTSRVYVLDVKPRAGGFLRIAFGKSSVFHRAGQFYRAQVSDSSDRMYTKGHAIKAAGWNDKAGMDLQTDRGPSRQMKRETQDKFRSKVVLDVSFGHY
jgi:hypothetical protein